ncbi:SRPBCC domain-containing protein [Dactylosporangium sp. NPDC050688]|uniref:SRPBCC domain-containing protein n=1 Tax=Dactylosporangium sp. NPDC050688 TaxID=3157217 RepID=UPI0033F61027
MTEIRVDVDLEHPPPAVWRALTEAHLVTDWLATTQFMVRDDGTFTFQAAALAGLEDPIEGEVVTTEAARRLVMRWSGENLHTVVALTLDERAGGGTRLTLTQSGFLGPQGTMRRRVLRTTYQQLFEGPFAAALARQTTASPTVSDAPAVVRRNDGGPFNRLPRQLHAPSRSAPGLSSQVRSTAGPRSTTTMPGFAAAVLGARATGVAAVPATGAGETMSTHRLGALRSAVVALVRRAWRRAFTGRDWSADRRSQAVAAGAAILLLVAMSALLVGKATAPHPAKPPRTGGGVAGPAQATVPAAPTEGSPRAATISSTSASASAPPATATPAPSAVTPGGAQLTAQARAENLTLTSYRVTVTIANPGPAPSADWTVTVVLPLLDLAVRNVDGAVMTRTGLKVIFTPVDTTRTIRPSGSATLRFEVEGLGVRNAPIDCTIDGRPCTQVSG